MKPPPWKKTSRASAVAAPTARRGARAGRRRSRSRTAPTGWRPPVIAGVPTDRAAALGDRQRLGAGLPGQPLEAQHQLGVDGQRLRRRGRPAARRARRCTGSGSAMRAAQAEGLEAVAGPSRAQPIVHRRDVTAFTDMPDSSSLSRPTAVASSHGEGVPEETFDVEPPYEPDDDALAARREVRRPLPRPRAVLAALQPAGARARRGPEAAAARADPLPGDLHQQPRRVLHGPGGRPQAPDRRRAGRAGRVRADADARCSS